MIPADIAETKESSPNRCGVIYRSKCYIIIKSCYIVIIFSFLFVVKEMTDLLYLFKILISDKKAQKYREFQPYWDKIFLPQAAEMPCIFKCFLYHLIYNANHDSETYFIILRFCLWQNFIFTSRVQRKPELHTVLMVLHTARLMVHLHDRRSKARCHCRHIPAFSPYLPCKTSSRGSEALRPGSDFPC